MSGGYPPLLSLADEAAYRAYFVSTYCSGTVSTFDGIEVRFRRSHFEHCCFESSRRDTIKDTFSAKRAERLHWIEMALKDAHADRFQGWDKVRKCHDGTRRVTLVCGDFVVVIGITGVKSADFITCYVADTPYTLAKIKKSPKWI